MHYKFPAATKVDRIIAKSKIYQHATPNTKIKALFTQQIEKIIWRYKLSPETINLPATDRIKEIQIFTIKLKTARLAPELLQIIDNAIPSPILFNLSYQNQCQYIASYKQTTEKNKLHQYFKSEWYPATHPQQPLPIVLTLEALYENCIKSLIPLKTRPAEKIQVLVDRMNECQNLEKKIKMLKNKIAKEKQFNRKVTLNRELNQLSARYNDLYQ